MITAYYTETKKYLQKGEYIKYFNEVKSLAELLSHIKVPDKILVKANSKDILAAKITNRLNNVSYEVITDIDPLTTETIQSDLQALTSGAKSYVAYRPKNKLLGDKVYITGTDACCRHINQHGKHLAVSINQLPELLNNPQAVMIKNCFEGKDININFPPTETPVKAG